jgi:hypothetical protein
VTHQGPSEPGLAFFLAKNNWIGLPRKVNLLQSVAHNATSLSLINSKRTVPLVRVLVLPPKHGGADTSVQSTSLFSNIEELYF